MVTNLKYGNTNTYFIHGTKGSILLDTDYAVTLQMFYKEIKKNDISLKDITCVLAMHYHPDHMGLVGELVSMFCSVQLKNTRDFFLHLCLRIKEKTTKRLSFFRDNLFTFLKSGDTIISAIFSEELYGFYKT